MTLVKLWLPYNTWPASFWGFFLAFLIIQSIILFSRGGMGAGDRNLLMLMGYLVGAKYTVITFVLAIFLATVFVLIVKAFKAIKINAYLPFGPFLIFAFYIALIFGDNLYHFYLHLY